MMSSKILVFAKHLYGICTEYRNLIIPRTKKKKKNNINNNDSYIYVWPWTLYYEVACRHQVLKR